jgi:fructokinase
MNAQDHLFARVRRDLRRSLNGYIQAEEIGSALDSYVVPPGLGAMAGPLGALAVAAEAAG